MHQRIMTPRLVLTIALVTFLFGSTARSDTVNFDFSTGDHGFVGEFTDYFTYLPDYSDERYMLTAGLRPLPEHLGGQSALYISGNNHSDDLFMYFKKQVGGLLPNTPYQLGFAIEFATEAAFESGGIGGSPAHAVFLMAGASAIEPRSTPTMEGTFRRFRLNLDKGNQSQPGADALILGDISRPPGGPPGRYFELVSRSSDAQSLVTSSDANGNLWMFFGTESGFEGITQLYYTDFRATLTPIPEPQTLMLALIGMLAVVTSLALRHSLIRH